MSLELTDEQQTDLRTLAEREDLRTSRYARALLEAAETGG